MFKTFLFISIFSLLQSCNSEQNQQDNSDPIVTNHDTISTLESEIDFQTFEWSLKADKNEFGKVQTDVALLVNWDNKTYTVEFFTALGNWSELDVNSTSIAGFPENCTSAIESKSEACFWAIRENSHHNYEILFGGIENNTAYAVLNYGFFKLENEIFSYDVGNPEVVEVYTDYGYDL